MPGEVESPSPTDAPARPAATDASWRPTDYVRARRKRTAQRLLLSLGCVVLVAVLLVLVVRPLAHPRVALLAAAAGETGSSPDELLRTLPSSVSPEDVARWQQLAAALAGRATSSGAPPEAASGLPGWRRFEERLPLEGSAAPDVLILYLTGHCVPEAGSVRVRWTVASDAAAQRGIDLRDVLARLAEQPSSVKLLVLDAGGIAAEPWWGLSAGGLARNVRDLVARTRDDRLWVLVSHSVMERSHQFPGGRQSVFSHVVMRGLAGQADADRDRVVDLAELFRYVAGRVSDQVRRATDGTARQTPMLLWGGGTDFDGLPAPRLVPVVEHARNPVSQGNRVSEKAGREGEAPAEPQSTIRADSPLRLGGSLALPAGSPPSPPVPLPRSGGEGGQQAVASAETEPLPIAAQEIVSSPPQARVPGAAGAASAENQSATVQTATTPPTANSRGPQTSPAGTLPVAAADLDPMDVPELLAEAWRLRDALAQRDRPGGSPVDDAPHLWRELERELLLLEQHARSGAEDETVRAALLPLVRALQKLAAGTLRPQGEARGIVERIAVLTSAEALPLARPVSLAVAERQAALSRSPVPSDVQSAVDALGRLIAGGTRQEFQEWVAKAPPESHRDMEIRLAARLIASPKIEPQLLRLALETRRTGERACAGCRFSLPWVRQPLETADRLRLDAERELYDRIGPTYQERARRLLEQALRAYRTAEDDTRFLRAADHLCRDLMHRLPHYLAWHRATGGEPNLPGPRHEELRRLMTALRAVQRLLGAGDPSRWGELRRQVAGLREAAAQVESGLHERTVAALTQPPFAAGDAYRMEILLGTPLPRHAARQALLYALAQIERGPTASRQTSPPVQAVPTGHAMTASDWRRVRREVELEAQYAGLADEETLDDFAPLAAVERGREAFQEAHAQWRDGPDDPRREERLWKATREFGEALRHFSDGLPGHVEHLLGAIPTAAADGDTTERLLAADRMLRMLDPRDADRVGRVDPAARMRQIRSARWADWLLGRLERAMDDASPAEAEFLAQTVRAARFRNPVSEGNRVSSNAGEPLAPSPSAPLPQSGGEESRNATTEPPWSPDVDVSLPTRLALAADGQAVLPLSLRPRGGVDVPAWVVLDYDPDLLDVRWESGTTLFVEDRLRDELRRQAALAEDEWLAAPEAATAKREPPEAVTDARRAAQYPLRPDVAGRQPCVRLTPGQATEVRLVLRGKSAAVRPARLVVKVIAGTTYLRHAVDVELASASAVDLVVAGPDGAWTRTGGGFALYPFPNRVTAYQFLLANRSAVERKVDVALIAPAQPLPADLPEDALPGDVADALLADRSPLPVVAALSDIVVPAGGSVSLPFPLPAPAAPPQPPAEGDAQPAGPPPNASDGPANATPLPGGLLCIITDRETGRKTLRGVRLAPQRPRRYVRAEVGYDRREERIEIRVVPQDGSLVPPGGVTVQAAVAEGLADGAAARLEGRIAGPDDEARLWIEVPEEPGRTVTLYLHVDGYPRALVYRVPCDRDSSRVPEDTGRHAIRLIVPGDGGPYPVPTAAIPVVVQCDVPVGSYANGTDFIEVGIDQDRDRELQGDPTQRLAWDRHVEVLLTEIAPDGRVAVMTHVGDHHLVIPTAGVRNARVELLAQCVVEGRSAWSGSVEAIFDGLPPTVNAPRTNPPDGTIVQGNDLLVSVLAIDENLSGVAKVEAAYDVERLGAFAEGVKPIPGQPAEYGRWVVKLPTAALKPGRHTVLLRATDHVGNVGDYARVRIGVISPEEYARQQAARTNTVSGTVSYAQQPIESVTVRIQPVEPEEKPPADQKPPPPIADVTTDAQGSFLFPKVPLGQYTVTATAVVKNKRRTATAPVTVVPLPARVEPLEMKFE